MNKIAYPDHHWHVPWSINCVIYRLTVTVKWYLYSQMFLYFLLFLILNARRHWLPFRKYLLSGAQFMGIDTPLTFVFLYVYERQKMPLNSCRSTQSIPFNSSFFYFQWSSMSARRTLTVQCEYYTATFNWLLTNILLHFFCRNFH